MMVRVLWSSGRDDLGLVALKRPPIFVELASHLAYGVIGVGGPAFSCLLY